MLNSVWEGLSSLIAETLVSGKNVAIPYLGTFTVSKPIDTATGYKGAQDKAFFELLNSRTSYILKLTRPFPRPPCSPPPHPHLFFRHYPRLRQRPRTHLPPGPLLTRRGYPTILLRRRQEERRGPRPCGQSDQGIDHPSRRAPQGEEAHSPQFPHPR